MGQSLSVIAALSLGLALMGCTNAVDSSAQEDAAMPSEEGVVVADETLAAAEPRGGNCVIETEGRVWLDGPCEHTVNSPGSIVLNSGAGEAEDYAYLDRVSETQATGTWSGGGGAEHAHASLGDLTRDGACWVNDTARICLSPAAEADFGVPTSQ